jgi:hypothetical protein
MFQQSASAGGKCFDIDVFGYHSLSLAKRFVRVSPARRLLTTT